MTGLLTLTQTQLDAWVVEASAFTRLGRLPDYIPLLAKANLHWVAVQLQQVNGKSHSAGEVERPFTLMSVVKPLVLLFLLEQLGWEQVFTHVGMDPSNQSFHSLTQLREDRGFPRNPMINSGAIALAALLPGADGVSRCEALRQWLNQMSGSHLALDEQMLTSVRSLSNEANRAIAELLAKSGYLGSVETALDTYNQICCLSGTVADLAKLGMLLVAGGAGMQKPANTADSIQNSSSALNLQHLKTVNALMLTCGLYEASGRFAVRIGLPTKSGVSGALLSIVPGQGAIACYSPALDSTGNSVAGLFLIEKLAQELNLSVFSS
jgi:glutaminase